MSFEYLLSQFLVVVYYFLLMSTYQMKSRGKVLITNFFALVVMGFSYFLLDAYTGLAMVFVALIRNMVFFIGEKRRGSSNKIYFKDVVIILMLTIVLVISSIFTYDGWLSLMSPISTWLYTVSIWQKSTTVYKILGVPASITGITYNVYIHSLLGVVLEATTLTSAVVGFFKDKRRVVGC